MHRLHHRPQTMALRCGFTTSTLALRQRLLEPRDSVVVGPPEDLDALTSLFRDKLEEAVRATPGEPCSPLN